MRSQTVWNDKTQSLETIYRPGSAPKAEHEMPFFIRQVLLYCAMMVLAAPLYWLLPAATHAAGLEWRAEYALRAIVGIVCLAIFARYLTDKYLRLGSIWGHLG